MPGRAAKQAGGKALHDLFREVFASHAALSRVMDGIHAQAGLSTSQHKILRTLRRIGPAPVPDLAAVLGVSRQFVQAVCNDLCSNGFIEFTDNPRHKRSKLVVLTDSGRNAFRRARRKENKIIERTLPGINPGKAAEARELLASIRKVLEKIPVKDGP
jgi:DNA-binding MarR family transcriptional regulator